LHKLYLLGYNVYAFDLPNHGVNSLTDEKYMFDDYCNYSLGKINERKKRKVILMGHSMGGGIAQVIATQIKHIKCLILEDPLQEGAVVNIVKRAIGGLTNGNNIIAT
jgi:pimeloyl-ACP methyl ester carboxylesterase